MGNIRLSIRRDVEEALASMALAPPPPPPNLKPGTTADLRSAMARFSNGEAHRQRRHDVVQLIERMDVEVIEAAAYEEALSRLDSPRVEAVSVLADQVPTRVLARLLGVPENAVPGLTEDVKAMVDVIGRGADSTATSDEAVSRILDTCTGQGDDPMAMASLLYQNHDATSALTAATILANAADAPRRSAISTTVRVALTDTVLAGCPVAESSTVVLDLEAARLEFGFGPHRCPGNGLAEAVVSGIINSLEHQRYQLRPGEVKFHSDGRPRTLPMERTT